MSLLRAFGCRSGSRVVPVVQQSTVVTPIRCSSHQPLPPEENFWKKNERLNRPVSPHMTIYKFPLPALMSGAHRGTGLLISTALSAFAIGSLGMPHSFSDALLSSSLSGSVLLTSIKFLIAWPFIYHSVNGMRHLSWDLGKGLKMNQIYSSGYAIMGISFVLALVAAAM